MSNLELCKPCQEDRFSWCRVIRRYKANDKALDLKAKAERVLATAAEQNCENPDGLRVVQEMQDILQEDVTSNSPEGRLLKRFLNRDVPPYLREAFVRLHTLGSSILPVRRNFEWEELLPEVQEILLEYREEGLAFPMEHRSLFDYLRDFYKELENLKAESTR